MVNVLQNMNECISADKIQTQVTFVVSPSRKDPKACWGHYCVTARDTGHVMGCAHRYPRPSAPQLQGVSSSVRVHGCNAASAGQRPVRTPEEMHPGLQPEP